MGTQQEMRHWYLAPMWRELQEEFPVDPDGVESI
jgi:hypothetical protein